MDDRENDHLSKPDARMRYGGAPPNVPFLTSTYPGRGRALRQAKLGGGRAIVVGDSV